MERLFFNKKMPIKFGWEGKPSRSHKQLNPSLLEGWLYCLDSLTWIKIYYQNIKWLLFLRKKNIKWLFIVKTICLKKSLFDTIKEQINKKIEELLQLYYNNSFVLSSFILFQGEGTGLVSFYTKRDLDLSLKEQVQQQGTSPTIFLFI